MTSFGKVIFHRVVAKSQDKKLNLKKSSFFDPVIIFCLFLKKKSDNRRVLFYRSHNIYMVLNVDVGKLLSNYKLDR